MKSTVDKDTQDIQLRTTNVVTNNGETPDIPHTTNFQTSDKIAKGNIQQTLTGNALSEEELQNFAMQLLSSISTEFQRGIAFRSLAKQKGVSSEEIEKEIREYTKNRIRMREKGNLRHFHRTNMENFKTIVETGRLLSRSKLKILKPEIQIPGWSARDDIMMTRDKYDDKGNLREVGFADQEVVGATGGDIILVFKESIMDRGDYDTTSYYPTISDLPIADYCESIIVKSPTRYQEAKDIVTEHHMDIPVVVQSEWKRS